MSRADVKHVRRAREQEQTAPSSRSSVVAYGYLAVGLALCAVYLFLPQTAQNIAQNVAGASAVVAIAYGIRRNRPSASAPWLFMGLGLLLLFVGDSLWTYYEEVLHIESPFPSVADVAYLAGYLPLAIGLLLIVRERRPGHDRGSLIDAAIVTVAFGIGSWIFLIEPTITPGLRISEVVVSVLYPLVDILLIAVVATLAFGLELRAVSYGFILASLISLIVADSLYLFGTTGGWYKTGNPIDIGWILCYVLWGAAALHPSMRQLTEEGKTQQIRFTRRRLAIYGVAVTSIPVMRIALTFMGGTKQGTVIASGTAVAALLVLARMSGLLGAVESAALQDALTGLPNRRLLLDRLAQAFKRAERTRTPVAIFFLDLRGFKLVNDEHGHEAGDLALIEIGDRIRKTVRGADTVARLGGDEFVVVCEGLRKHEAEALGRRIRSEVAMPIDIDGHLIAVAVDLGLAVEHAPDGDVDVAELLRTADRAMYHAKASAREDPAAR